jgi:cell division protein FtsB
MRYTQALLVLLLISSGLVAQQPVQKPIRILDSMTTAEKNARNPLILRAELDSLIKLYAPVQVISEPSQDLQPVPVSKNSSLPVILSSVIILMLAWLIYINIRQRKLPGDQMNRQKEENEKDKKSRLSPQQVEARISELKTELFKLSKENEGLNRVIKEYNGIQHEYDSLRHGMFKAYKVKNYPGNDTSKAEAAAMQSVLGTENALAGYAYEKFLKPILAIADANKNSPAKTTEADREKILDLLVSLSLLYIEYLYLRINDLSIGGKMVERIQAVARGNVPDISVLRKLDKEFGSRALVVRMALDKASLQKLYYPVFDETNLNNQ